MRYQTGIRNAPVVPACDACHVNERRGTVSPKAIIITLAIVCEVAFVVAAILLG